MGEILDKALGMARETRRRNVACRQRSAGQAELNPRPRRISVLGATGSVGLSTLDLIARDSADWQVVALTAHRNVAELAALARKHRAELAVIGDPRLYGELKERLAGTGIAAAAGEPALIEAAGRRADIVMAAIVGAAGLKPTLAAVRQGTRIALANKECLVSAGPVFLAALEASGAQLLPVDSEHSAAFQALDGTAPERIEKIVLTASGGPFRNWSEAELAKATPEQAIKHPNWSMGPKISVDSATLMNKGLEIIEAYHLFPVEAGQLEVVVHPQSVVHAMVVYTDGSVLAQLGCPDMRTPIAYSLAWPGRMAAPVERLDLVKMGTLSFEAPDLIRFPALRLARESLDRGGAAPTVLNAANEEAVASFLSRNLGFLEIAQVVEETLNQCERAGMLAEPETLDAVLDIDAAAREVARSLLRSAI